jgi:two-component system chemotaxis response regulator CheY
MGKKVLIVDDSATVRLQVGTALSHAGFDVVEAVDGQDGLTKIQRMRDISAVICDVNMPRMNGIEMLIAVKSGGQNASLPIVMLTTEGQPALIDKARQAGAKAWIVKPFKAELLVGAIRKLTT